MGLLLIPGPWASGADAHTPAGVEFISPDEAPASVPAPPVENPNELEWRRRRIADALLQIEGAGFYEAVGRPDLADRYETRRSLKTAVPRDRGAPCWGRGSWYSSSSRQESLVPVTRAVRAGLHSPAPSFVVPDSMMLGGLVLLLLPSVFDTDPVNEREKLGLAEAEAAARARARPPRRPANLSIVPRLEHDGAALTLSLRF